MRLTMASQARPFRARIGQVEAMDRAAGIGGEIAPAVQDQPLGGRGNRKKGFRHSLGIERGACHAQILLQIARRRIAVLALPRVDGQHGAPVGAVEALPDSYVREWSRQTPGRKSPGLPGAPCRGRGFSLRAVISSRRPQPPGQAIIVATPGPSFVRPRGSGATSNTAIQMAGNLTLPTSCTMATS